MTTRIRRTFRDLTMAEIEMLRDAPYERPYRFGSKRRTTERKRADALVAEGLLESDVEGMQYRCTDEGAREAAPITIAEMEREARLGIDACRPLIRRLLIRRVLIDAAIAMGDVCPSPASLHVARICAIIAGRM